MQVVVDFSNLSTLEEYRTLIEKEFKDIDIGFVCLNAGITVLGNLGDLTDKDFESVIRVNGLHVTYGAKVFLEIFAKREARSALVITSSLASNFAWPGMAIYGATKSLVRLFGEAVHYEVKNKTDVLVWNAAGVRTKITTSVLSEEQMKEMHASPDYIDPDYAVECAFKDLGHT